jgi:hypothetical protein
MVAATILHVPINTFAKLNCAFRPTVAAKNLVLMGRSVLMGVVRNVKMIASVLWVISALPKFVGLVVAMIRAVQKIKSVIWRNISVWNVFR